MMYLTLSTLCINKPLGIGLFLKIKICFTVFCLIITGLVMSSQDLNSIYLPLLLFLTFQIKLRFFFIFMQSSGLDIKKLILK